MKYLEVVGKSGLTKDQLLLECIEGVYKATPELEREMPKKNLKILNTISLKQQRLPTVVEKFNYTGTEDYTESCQYKNIPVVYM